MLDEYNTSDVYYQFHTVDTDLKELTTAEEAEQVRQLTIKKAEQVKAEGVSAIIICAFGELGVKELKDAIGVPIMALGPEAIKQASRLSKKNFTIISGMLEHNEFWQPMIDELNVSENYVVSKHSPNMTPIEIRKDPDLIDKLVEVAGNEITNNKIDSFTLGCGSFIGVAPKLEKRLQTKFGPHIHVVDPIKITFEHAAELCH